MKGQKYHSIKTTIDGISFSSRLEGLFYRKMMEDPRIEIKRLQVPFILQEGFVHDKKKIQPIKYIADFEIDVAGDRYIVDSKGMETPEFKMKRKMFWKKYPDERLIVAQSWKQFCEIIF